MSYRDDLKLLVQRIPEEVQGDDTYFAAQRLLTLIEEDEGVDALVASWAAREKPGSVTVLAQLPADNPVCNHPDCADRTSPHTSHGNH